MRWTGNGRDTHPENSSGETEESHLPDTEQESDIEDKSLYEPEHEKSSERSPNKLKNGECDTHMAAQVICSLQNSNAAPSAETKDPTKSIYFPFSEQTVINGKLWLPLHLNDHNYFCQMPPSESQLANQKANLNTKNHHSPSTNSSSNEVTDETVQDVAQILTQMKQGFRVNTSNNKQTADSNLNITVTVKKPYSCTYHGCERGYWKSSHLKAHLRTHTGSVDFFV